MREPYHRVRMSPVVGLEFIAEGGEIVVYVARRPGAESTFHRSDPAEPQEGR